MSSKFDDFLQEQLQDPEIRKEYESLQLEHTVIQAEIDAGQMSIPACFIPSFRREDTANPVDKIPQFREWSTIIPELDTADFLNLYTVFMRLTA